MSQEALFGDELERIVTADFLADCLSVARPTISKLTKDGMPKEAYGKFDLKKCVAWYVDRSSEKATENDPTAGKQKLLLLEAQTEKVNLENAKLRGEVLSSELVASAMNEIGTIISSQLDGLAPRCAAQFSTISDPAIIQQELFNECRDIRNNISTAISKHADEKYTNDDGRDSEAATPKDSKRVGRRGKDTATRSPGTGKVEK